jgi:uncharacterized membrane protein
VVEEESLFFSVSAFLWCFFFFVSFFAVSVVDDEEAAGVEEAGAGVDWAKAGPAIRANAMTGMSFLNMWSPKEFMCAPGARGGGIITGFPAAKSHMTAK